MVTLGEPGDDQVSRDVNFACRIHPAAQSDIGKQQWVTGFHNELSLCVKCCRMVDSVPRWQLSLSGPIQSDHLTIAVCDDTLGRKHYSVHSWKAGPDCGKLILLLKAKISHCVTAASNNGFVANFASSLCKLCQFVVLVKEIRPQSSTARTSGSLYCSRYHTASSLGFRGRGK